MKHVTIVCLDAFRSQAVETMQRLGTLHVVPCQTTSGATASKDLAQALERKNLAIKALDVLSERDAQPATTQMQDGETALQQTLEALDTLKNAQAKLNDANRDLKLVEPWGSFDKKLLPELAQKGIYVELCSASEATIAKLNLPEGALVHTISKLNGNVFFAVISDSALDGFPLPKATLPEITSQKELNAQLAQAEQTIADCNVKLDTLAAAAIPAIQSLMPQIENDVAFAQACDSMGVEDALAFITGYIPENKLDAFLNSARKNGWAVRYEDIKPDDTNVPTLLDIPKRFDMAQWIFDFVGILPGYFETDISVAMYLFLSLFCGILIGDAGYGAILTGVTAFFLFRSKTMDKSGKNALKVLLTMSACTFTFGALSGNWFGIPPEKMPIPFSGLPWLSEDATQNNIKMLCFFIGALHMSLAHAWSAYNQRKTLREVIGNAGWAIFLWANFFATAKLIAGGIPGTETLMYALYAVGFVAILTCGINWKDAGDVIYSPFSFINSFVDILSYIRLFAVGLSGVYIAKSFNDMAGAIWDSNPWLIPVAILILIIGHLLNVAMAALSILVHGIRLNTLEFSGHIGLTWCGRPYKPLKRHDEN